MTTLADHLRTLATEAAEQGYSLEAVAAYISGRLDAEMQWPDSPVGQLLEAVDGPALEAAVLVVLEHVAAHGPGGARTLFTAIRTQVTVWARRHPERVATRKAARDERRERRTLRRYDRTRNLSRSA